MKSRSVGQLLVPATLLATCAVGVARQGDPRAQIFVARGCTECHAVTDLGLRARTDAAPDLSYAAEEAPLRYGISLSAFLSEPVGVMRMVLVTHVRLSLRDRDSVVVLLERLDAERRARQVRFTELPH